MDDAALQAIRDRHAAAYEDLHSNSLDLIKVQDTARDVPVLLSELEAAQARLDKVRALHQRCDDGEQGYRPDGSYGTVAPCCKTCGSYGEYTEPWPCATARALGLGEEGTE